MIFNEYYECSYVEEQQECDESIKAKQYLGQIFSSARDMRDQYSRGDYNMACVSAEQVTENSLNVFAELNGGLPAKYKNHTTLVNRKKEFCGDLEISNNSLRRMQKAYKNRYPNQDTSKIEYQYTKAQAKNMIIDACKVGDRAMDALDISLSERFNELGHPENEDSIERFKMQNLLFNGTTNEYKYIL